MKEMTLAQLIEKLDEVGFDEGVRRLEVLHRTLEERQAYLFGGDPDEVRQAAKMTPMLLKQDETLIRLHQISALRKGEDDENEQKRF